MSSKKELFELIRSFFDKTYVITLKRSEDRHELIRYELDGLDYQLFWGVDGRDLNMNKLMNEGLYHPSLTKLLKKRAGRPPVNMSVSKIGCALSHVKIYQEIVEKNYQRVLILEDDLNVNLKAVANFKNALDELPDDWELFYLGYSGANSDPSVLLRIQKSLLSLLAKGFYRFDRLKMLDPEVIRCWFPRQYSKHLNKAGAYFGTHAYGVTVKGAKKILSYQTPVVQESDNILAELCSYQWLNAFDVKEHVFTQNKELPSTIK